MPASTPPRSRVALALAVVYLVWGTTYFAMKVAMVDLGPLGMGGARFLFAGVVLYAIERARGAASPTPEHWRSAALTGTLMLVCGNGGVALAQGAGVSSSLTAIAVSTMPLFAALWARLWGETPTRMELVGIALGLVGIVLLNTGAELRATPFGALALVVSPVCWALGSMWARRLPMASGRMATAAQMLVAGPAMLMLGAANGESLPTRVGVPAALAFAYLSIFGSLLGLSAYGWLLSNTRPAIATSYAYVNPIVALSTGYLLAGERLDARASLGAAVVLGGVVALSMSRRPAR